MMKIIFFLTIMLSLVACKEEGSGLYHIPLGDAIKNTTQLQPEECIDSIQYIRLQTVDSGFIGNISKIIPWQDYLYISDQESRVFLFRQSGEFLHTIGTIGRGPGEYIGVGDLMVDPECGDLWITTMDKILIYNKEGILKKELDVDPRLQVGTIRANGQPIFIAPMSRMQADTFPLLFECNKEGQIQQKIYSQNPHIALPMPFFNWLYERDGQVFFKEEFSDTICRVDEAFIPHPYAVLELGGYGFTPQHFDFQYEQDWANRYRLLGAWDFNQTMLLKVQQGLYGHEYTSFIYCKSTNKIGMLGSSKTQEGFMLDHVLHIPVSGNGDKLICWISSASLKDNEQITGQELTAIAKDISLDSNPVIALLYMK